MSTDRKIVELIINSEQAQKELDDINKKLIKARENKEKAVQIGNKEGISKYTKEIDRLEHKMKNMQTRSESVRKTIEQIDKATPKQLKATIKAINKELDSGRIERNSKEWKALQERLSLVNQELTKIKEETKAATSLSDEVAEWGNKWMGIAMNFMAVKEAIDSVMQKANEAVNKFADMEEHLAGVVKYTGMTKEEVDELNQEFKKMDTRTPREKLNDLAGDAGRLGIQAKKDVLDFVDAANQINVALGEDLGENAVKNIGKLTQLYGINDELGLKKGMLAIASIINDQGQSSSAAEGYIMDYTSRMAGLAVQAGITASQIMAYASVTDQSMIRSEEASTALSNLIQKLFQEPEKMAQAVGIPVKEFANTIKTDANEAVLQWLAAVKAMGGMDKVAPMLKDVSMTGAGVTKMITSLANNVELLRSTQEQANKSFKEGTSITNEYNVANNTVQAKIDKALKKGSDIRIELGKRLYPIMREGLHLGNKITKLMIVMLDFGAKHSASIINVAIALGVLTAAVKIHTVATAIMTVKTKAFAAVQATWNSLLAVGRIAVIAYTYGIRGANKAMKTLNATTKRNIYVLLATALASVVIAITELITKEKELTAEEKLRNKIQKDNQDVEKKANSEMAEKASKVNALTAIIHNNNLKLEDRRKAVEALKKIIPKYYAELDEEGRITKENTKAVKDHIEMLKQEAMLKAAKDKISSLSSEKLDVETAKDESKARIAETKKKIEEWKKENAILAKYVKWNPDGTLNTKGRPNEHPAYVASRKEVNNYIPKEKRKRGYSKQDWLYSVWLSRFVKLENLNRELVSENKKIEEQTKKSENIDSRISSIAEKAKETSALIDSLIQNAEEEEEEHKGSGSKDKLDEAKEKLNNLYELKKLKNRILFEGGQKNREDFIKENERLEIEQLEKEQSLYKQGTKEWISLENKKRDAINAQKKRANDYSLHQIEIEIADEKNAQLKKYAEGEIDEKEYQKRITDIQIEAMRRRANYLLANDPGSEAQIKAQEEYTEAIQEEQINRQKEFLKKADSFQKEYNQRSNEEKMQDELLFLDEMVKQKIISEEKKKEYEDKIRKKYQEEKKSPLSGETNELASSVIMVGQAIDSLQNKLKDGKASWEDYAAVGMASMGMIMNIMNTASQLMQANTQIEEAKIRKKYDAEIKAAGNNEKRKKKIEEKRDREIAKMKTKQNKKAMKLQIAQAIASTAMAAINAYASASQINWILGPIAAAAATAAGMIQIATIKKQHEAQEAGYFEGGFTGGNDYRRKAGIVHEGEFVANHRAVNNPAVLPYLRTIDYAQRNNTISNITERDMMNLAPTAAASHTTTIQVVDTSSAETAEAIGKLNKMAEKGIPAYVVLDGTDGLDRQWKKYNDLKNI